ncbi:MAG: hypothetical protein GY938_27830 [Ketobacter sp.]|nr:hypothetical protein [Ketobacter sp.]
MNRFNTMNGISHNSGAALVVGLLILLLATLISVSAMTDANLQEKMAANSQNTNRIFQAAESGIDSKLSSIELGTTAMLTQAINVYLAGSGTNPTESVSLSDTDISTNIAMEVIGIHKQYGQSMSAEEGTSQLTGYTFKLTSNASASGSGAEATAIQGFFYN